jgi:hypothetical protein
MFMSMCRKRIGYSLLEVVLASGICATALVPALAMVRDSMTLAERIDKRHLLLLYGVSKMEERLAVVAADWTEIPQSGDYGLEGHADIRFNATSSDEPANGGIIDRLMSVAVTIYSDDDGDDSLDANEMRIVLTTKIAKMITYETKAGG